MKFFLPVPLKPPLADGFQELPYIVTLTLMPDEIA